MQNNKIKINLYKPLNNCSKYTKLMISKQFDKKYKNLWKNIPMTFNLNQINLTIIKLWIIIYYNPKQWDKKIIIL